MIQQELKIRERVAIRLSKALSASGLTQAKFAMSISESRTTISHIVNAVKPSTKNPVHKSLTIINRVNRKLKNMGNTNTALDNLRSAVDQAHADYITALGLYTEAVARGSKTPSTAKSARADSSQLNLLEPTKPNKAQDAGPKKTPVKPTRARKPAVGHFWKSRDPRRHQVIRLVAVHASHVSYENVTTMRKGRYAASAFNKRFEFLRTAGKK